MNRMMLMLAMGLLACGGDESGGETERAERTAPDVSATRVEAAVLQTSALDFTLDLPGEFEGSEDAILASAYGGFVEKVFVHEGEEVKKGQTIAWIDREPKLASLEQAKAQLAQAEDDLSRLEQLGEMAIAAQVEGLRTQVDVAKSQVRLARNSLERATITAPFSGVVGEMDLDVGEVVGPGAPVARLVQLDPLKVSLSVSDRDIVALQEGMEAQVTTAARGASVPGVVSRVSPVANLSTRSFMVEVEVPNPDRTLLPGMIARVKVQRPIRDDVVVLPQDWLVTRLDGYGVFVVGDDNIARWRELTLGDVVSGQVVVTDGLSVGDKVVTTGQHDLVDGDVLVLAREGVCCEAGRVTY